MTVLVLVAVTLVLVFASGASWGPGTHIYFGTLLMKRMKRRLRPAHVKLLEAHHNTFLYGSVAADIINFKRYGGLKNHCHNWNMKERIEELIEEEHEEAFLMGYLCHLAADVVAHNHFVPFQLVYGLPPTVLGHTYWEARADSQVSEDTWHILDSLRCTRELHENDEIINQAVPRKALSLASNKWIFNNILLARARKSWRAVMDQMRRRNPRGEIHMRFLNDCYASSLENMYRVFESDALDQLRTLDPNGLASLKGARVLRRELVAKHGSRQAGSEESKAIAKRKYRTS